MQPKTTDEPLSGEPDVVTRDGSLDRRRDSQQASDASTEKVVRNGSLDSRREITTKQAAKKTVSNPRDGSPDRTRKASPKGVPNSNSTRNGSLDNARGGPGTSRGGLSTTRTAHSKKS